jgi:hypothetical protein
MAARAVAALPARYAKFLTGAAGYALLYFQIYGWAWHIRPASLMVAAALGIAAVPNAPKAPPEIGSVGPRIPPPEPLPPATGSQI